MTQINITTYDKTGSTVISVPGVLEIGIFREDVGVALFTEEEYDHAHSFEREIRRDFSREGFSALLFALVDAMGRKEKAMIEGRDTYSIYSDLYPGEADD